MTYDQHIASDPAISAWVSASAGTGKTKVLTDRVLRLLLAGATPAKILCITYTKAASAEMQQRIETQLGNWAIAEDVVLQKQLTELTGNPVDEKILKRARQLFAHVLDAPERIRIQTIHGFCQSVLMRFPLEAGVAPHFTLIDEHTSGELLSEARARLFRESRHITDVACREAIEELAVLISESSLNGLIEDIIAQRRKFIPWFDKTAGLKQLIERIYGTLAVDPDVTIQQLVCKHFCYLPEQERALRDALVALAQGEGESDKKTYQALDIWLRERNDYEAYASAFMTRTNEPRKVLNTKTTDKHYPPLKEVLLAEQRRVASFVDAALSFKVAQVTQHLMVIAGRLLDLYRKSKAAQGYMDYDDLILSTVDLLYRSGMAAWVLYKLDGGIDHLLVDEAQDTSPEQWRLVDILASEFFTGESARTVKRTVFIVGDEKQSIYSFQGAAPHAFDEMQMKLSKRAKAAGMAFKRVRLALSFRSTTPVLQAVDSVFSQLVARDGLVFTEQDISHDVHRKESAGRVELWPLQEAMPPEGVVPWHVPTEPSHSPKPEILCAKQIAETIGEWLQQRRLLLSQSRVIEPGDIMILVQRRGAFADAMLRALKQKGIAVAGADRLILTEHIAVMDCIALAEFLLLPQDDLTLAVLLKSPLIGLSEEALFELCHNRGKLTLWQRLRNNSKFEKAADYLSDLLAKVDFLPPYELFAYVLETCEGRKKLAERLGLEVEDPLNEFLSLTLQYTRIHSPSLQGFLHWLRSGATEIKRDMEKGRNEVRIMTVHGAKGLQAPIVILPDTTRPPRYDSAVLWSKVEEQVPLWSPFAEYDDPHYKKLKEQHRQDADREYRRLLYVAMTRAEDELYICGWKGTKPVTANCWYELIRQGMEAAEGVKQEGKKYVLSSEQLSAVTQAVKLVAATEGAALPEWVYSKPADEPTPPRPLAPSRMELDSGNALSPFKDSSRRERGLLIHRLLQYIPDVAADRRPEIMQRFIRRYGNNFMPEEQAVIAQEVMAILEHPEFAPVFASNSVAEASVTGKVQNAEGKAVIISGQIDRLSVQGDNVYIIDYKTNREVPPTEAHIPVVYLKQMEAYRQLIASIYPGKTIHCALLWTAEPRLMTLSHAILASLAA